MAVKRKWSSKQFNRDGHASDFEVMKGNLGYALRILSRVHGDYTVTTLDQAEIDSLAQQLDKWRTK